MSKHDVYADTGDEVTNGLRYIADSPPPEHGGFHPNAVATAKAALAELAALRKRCAEYEAALLTIGLGSGDVEAKKVALDAIDANPPKNDALRAYVLAGVKRGQRFILSNPETLADEVLAGGPVADEAKEGARP